MSYAPFHFEGRPLPPADELQRALCDERLAWIVRAAVVHEPFTRAVLHAAEALLQTQPAVALKVARSLMGRPLIAPICAHLPALEPALAREALKLLVTLARPEDARVAEVLAWALAQPGLRVTAWEVQGPREPQLVLPHLAALLTEAPQLAGPVARRFALVHTELCHEACRAIVELPLETRQAFAKELHKHLERIFSIRRWAECRKILFG